MVTKSIKKDAGWYTSYMDYDQGVCLIEAMLKKLNYQEKLLNTLRYETELMGEVDLELIIHSIRTLIDNNKPTTHTVGYFTWVD